MKAKKLKSDAAVAPKGDIVVHSDSESDRVREIGEKRAVGEHEMRVREVRE